MTLARTAVSVLAGAAVLAGLAIAAVAALAYASEEPMTTPVAPRVAYVEVPYGRSWKRGAFTCHSQRRGIVCRNAGGQVLFVSRQRAYSR